MKLFPAKDPLESVSIDIIASRLRTSRRFQYLLVLTDHLKKLVPTVHIRSLTAAEVAKQIANHWVLSYGALIAFITDNGSWFIFSLFQDVLKIVRVHNSFMTNYYPQNNVQVERLNRTIMFARRSYI